MKWRCCKTSLASLIGLEWASTLYELHIKYTAPVAIVAMTLCGTRCSSPTAAVYPAFFCKGSFGILSFATYAITFWYLHCRLKAVENLLFIDHENTENLDMEWLCLLLVAFLKGVCVWGLGRGGGVGKDICMYYIFLSMTSTYGSEPGAPPQSQASTLTFLHNRWQWIFLKNILYLKPYLYMSRCVA